MLPAEVVTPQLLRAWPLPEPAEDGDKNDRGAVLVVGGAESTPGAVLLTGLAALRVGAGKLQIATVEQTAVALAVAVPEAAVVGLPTSADGSLAPGADEIVSRCERASALVLGPGLIDTEGAGELLRAVLPRLHRTPVVLDGQALRALEPGQLDGLPAVLTPNDAELTALVDAIGQEGAVAAARRFGAAVCARGWVADRDGRTWRLEVGGIGLGTSGSGDVLAGLVGGALARGAEPAQAAVWGQYLHAAAGDLLGARVGRLGFLARELLDEVPSVLAQLRR